MVQPAIPDWSRYLVPSADGIDSQILPAQTPFNGGNLDCSNWAYVLIAFFNSDPVVNYALTITWLTYSITPPINPSNRVVVGPGQNASFVRPAIGRTVQMNFIAVNGVPSTQIRYTMLGMTHSMTNYEARILETSLIDDTTTYIGGGTKTIPANFWYEGPASVTIFSNNNTAAWVEFQFWQASDQAWHDFAIFQVLSWPNSLTHMVSFPPAPVRAVVNNQGAAQTISFHVLPTSQV